MASSVPGCFVSAGFPSPADDYTERPLDFNELFVETPETTFCVRIKGDSMIHEGLRDGDYVAVDRALEPKHGDIIVARLGDGFTIKKLYKKGEMVYLLPANPRYKPVRITEEMDFEVFGVVRGYAHLYVQRSL